MVNDPRSRSSTPKPVSPSVQQSPGRRLSSLISDAFHNFISPIPSSDTPSIGSPNPSQSPAPLGTFRRSSTPQKTRVFSPLTLTLFSGKNIPESERVSVYPTSLPIEETPASAMRDRIQDVENKLLQLSRYYEILQLIPNPNDTTLDLQLVANTTTTPRQLLKMRSKIEEYIEKTGIKPESTPNQMKKTIVFPQALTEESSTDPNVINPRGAASPRLSSSLSIPQRRILDKLSQELDGESSSDPIEASRGVIYYPANLAKDFSTDDMIESIRKIQDDIRQQKLQEACPIVQIIKINNEPFVQVILNDSASADQERSINAIIIKNNEKSASLHEIQESIEEKLDLSLNEVYQTIPSQSSKDSKTILSIPLNEKKLTNREIQKKINECVDVISKMTYLQEIPNNVMHIESRMNTIGEAEICVQSVNEIEQDVLVKIESKLKNRLHEIENRIEKPLPKGSDNELYSRNNIIELEVKCHNHLRGSMYRDAIIPFSLETKMKEGEQILCITIHEKNPGADLSYNDRMAMKDILNERLQSFYIGPPDLAASPKKKEETPYVILDGSVTTETNTDEESLYNEEVLLESELNEINGHTPSTPTQKETTSGRDSGVHEKDKVETHVSSSTSPNTLSPSVKKPLETIHEIESDLHSSIEDNMLQYELSKINGLTPSAPAKREAISRPDSGINEETEPGTGMTNATLSPLTKEKGIS